MGGQGTIILHTYICEQLVARPDVSPRGLIGCGEQNIDYLHTEVLGQS